MRVRLEFTIAGTALLSIVILLLIAGGGTAQTDPPVSGDWTVSDTTVIADRTVDLHGDLTVTSTGSLTLRNVTLKVFLSANGEHGIEIQSGGFLEIRDGDNNAATTNDASVVTAQPNSRSYHFIARSGSGIYILNSFIHRCGYTGTVGNTKLGLFVATDDANIEGSVIDDCLHGLVLDNAIISVDDSTISNSTYHGVNAQDSDVTLRGVTLADNGYEGARLVRGDALLQDCWVGGNRDGLQIRTGANVTVEDTTIKGNTDGLLMQIDANVIVTNCTFRGQAQYGIHAENRGTLVVSDSQISGATRTALYVFNDITVTSTNNLFWNNIFGARLKMDCSLTSIGDSFTSNTNSGIYLESTSDLLIIGGTVLSNSAGVKAEDASTIWSWDTTVEECSFEGYDLVDSDLMLYDGNILNCTGGGVVVDTSSTSVWTVNTGNSTVIWDSDITITRDFIINGDLTLRESVLIFSGTAAQGFACQGGDQDWENSTFRPDQAGEVFNFEILSAAKGVAWFVTVESAGDMAVPTNNPIIGTPFEFHRCVFKDSQRGLIVTSAGVVFDRCTFSGNTVGVTVKGVAASFDNCTFGSNSASDVEVNDDGSAALINCSFDPSKVVASAAGDSWSIWWIVHVKVKYPTGGAAAGATVTIIDSKGSTVYTGTTDGNGFIGNILLMERLMVYLTEDDRTPHTFNATLGAAGNEASIDITGHMLVTIDIADGAPPELTVTSHYNGEYIRTTVLTLRGTAYDAGSSVYRVEARIATQGWQTCTGTDTWEWTTNLPGDGTYPISVRARDIALNTITLYLNLTLDTLPPDIDVTVPPSPANNSLVGSPLVTIQGWVGEADVEVTAMGVTAEMTDTSFTLNLTLVDGLNKISIRAEDKAGNVATLEWWLQADLDAPVLTIFSPIDGSEHNETMLILTGATDPFVDVYYRVVQLSTVWSMLTVSGSGGFSQEISGLQQGLNSLEVMVRDPAGNEVMTTINVTVDTLPPRLLSTVPTDGANVNNAALVVRGEYSEPLSSLMVEDTVATLDGVNFTVALDLAEGLNQFTVVAKDALDNVLLSTLRFYLDVTSPSIDIPGFTFDQGTGDYLPFDTYQKVYLLIGTTELGATLYVDRWEEIVDSLGRFTATLDLEEGENVYEILVRDKAGNEYFTNVTIILDTYAPQLTVKTPEHMSTTSRDFVWVEGTVTQGDTVAVGEVEMVSGDGTFRLKVGLEQAVNRIIVVAYDKAGNQVNVDRLVFQKEDTAGLTGNPTLDNNCSAWMIIGIIVVLALAILLSFAWKEDDVLDRKEKALESVMEEDHIELDKPHLEPSSGYLQYDPTSPTGRKPEFEEKDDEEFISMDSFRRELEQRGK